MTGSSTVFRVNAPRIVHQTIAGETIIIDLDSGAYYSTDKAGAVIWEQIAQGISLEDVLPIVMQRYQGDPAAIGVAISGFVAELERTTLISRASQESSSLTAPSSPTARPDASIQPMFETPILHKYTDMQDLLLVDPIHEVGAEGWPGTRSTSAPADVA